MGAEGSGPEGGAGARPVRSGLVAVLLFLLALPLLGFTACGVFVGFGALVGGGLDGLPLAGLGLLCAAAGATALWRVARALDRVGW